MRVRIPSNSMLGIATGEGRSKVNRVIAERISARQYKSGSILVCTYVRTYVRSSAQARTSRRSLRRRRRLDVYALARVYSIG